jgi:hypothetical protein
VRDYGGGVRVGRPFGARLISPVRVGPVTLKMNTQHTLQYLSKLFAWGIVEDMCYKRRRA